MNTAQPGTKPASLRFRRLRQRIARRMRNLIAALLRPAHEPLILRPYALRLQLVPQPVRPSARRR